MSDQQWLIALTMFLKPLGFLFLLLLAYPFKRMAMALPDGKLKRLLLFRIGDRNNRG